MDLYTPAICSPSQSEACEKAPIMLHNTDFFTLLLPGLQPKAGAIYEHVDSVGSDRRVSKLFDDA